MRTSLPAKVKKLEKKVEKIAALTENLSTSMTYRARWTRRLTVVNNGMNLLSYGLFDISAIQDSIAALPYYDPSDPDVFEDVDGNDGDEQREYLFRSVYAMAECRNNYNIPVKCTMYIVMPKITTTHSASGAVALGLDAQNAPLVSSPLVFPTDSVIFNTYFLIEKHKTKVLEPGHAMYLSHSGGPFSYNPAFDTVTQANYYKEFDGAQLMVRIEGVVGHDSELNVGHSQAAVDISWDRTLKIEYAGGSDSKWITVKDNSDPPDSSGFIFSNKPTSMNQQYTTGTGF